MCDIDSPPPISQVDGFVNKEYFPITCGQCGIYDHVWRFVRGNEETWYDFSELEDLVALGVRVCTIWRKCLF
jgi:hypothetical protein